MSKSKIKKIVIPTSKPRNHLALAVKKRHSGLILSDKDKIVSKGLFKNNIRKGIYD